MKHRDFYLPDDEMEPPVHDDKVYHCVVCNKNTVDPYQGEDTCFECLTRIRRGG